MLNLKKIWHAITGYDPRLNEDGTITTKHGHRIIPFKVQHRPGLFYNNAAEHMNQPRVKDIRNTVTSVNYTQGQTVVLDKDSGNYYLKNADESDSDVTDRQPLGQIDLELEQKIFETALMLHKMKQLFGDCSRENPVCVDDSGKVYPKNNPEDIRGHVNIGPTVYGSGGTKPRRRNNNFF